MASTLPPVDALSDDEPTVPRAEPSQGQQLVAQAVPRRLPAKRKVQVAFEANVNVKALRHKVQSSCGCSCECFKPFRGDLFDQLVKLRKTMCQLEKPDQDNFVNSSEFQHSSWISLSNPQSSNIHCGLVCKHSADFRIPKSYMDEKGNCNEFQGLSTYARTWCILSGMSALEFTPTQNLQQRFLQIAKPGQRSF